MNINHIWSFLLNFSIVQGLILSLVLIIKVKKGYLSLFFLNLSYLIFAYVFELYDWEDVFPHLIWTNVPSWFLVAPMLYLHVEKSFANPKSHFRVIDLLHFVPAMIFVISSWNFYFNFDADQKLAEYRSFYDKTAVIDYVQIVYLAQIIIYAIVGKRLANRKVDAIGNHFSDSNIVHFKLLNKLYLGLSLYIVMAIGMSLIISLAFTTNFDYYIVVFLGLSLPIFFTTVYFLSPEKLIKSGIGNDPDLFSKTESPSIKQLTKFGNHQSKYANSPLKAEDLDVMLKKLQVYLKTSEAYRKGDLKISELSNELNIPSHHISQCLNQKLGKNFFEFVNEFRVEAVKRDLLGDKKNSLTLFAIASDCGFKSESSFYRIFKNIEGQTPKKFIDRNGGGADLNPEK